MATQAICCGGRWAIWGLATALIVLAGCGGGGGDGSSQAPPIAATVVIQGIVSDDPVEGATVTVTSLADGAVLATAVTGSGGVYSTLPILQSRLGSGYLLTAAGGMSVGQAFVGTLRAIYSAPVDYVQSHITIPMTAVVRAAENAVTDTRALAAKADEMGALAVARGVLPQDWRLVTAATNFGRTVAENIRQEGVDGYTTRLAWELVHQPLVPTIGTTCSVGQTAAFKVCTARIGPGGGKVYDASGINTGNEVVDIPAGATNCLLEAHATIANGNHSVRLRFAKVLGATQAANCDALSPVATLSNAITIKLPPYPAPNQIDVRDACASSDHPLMTRCLTTSAIEPAVFVTDSQTHRIGTTSHKTTSASPLIERRFGATLKRSQSADSTRASAAAVLFVNGYTAGGAFGGGDGLWGSTWGSLPDLVSKARVLNGGPVDHFEPYNFQWRTNASFHDVAVDLARVIDRIYTVTGNKKVHIVAHSFGGVLARTVLQRINPTALDVSAKVASLTTVGAPHSGIHDNGATVYNVPLPVGWIPPGPEAVCGQISCYQAGLRAGLMDWAINVLKTDDGVPEAGDLIARLSTTRNQLPAGLKVQVLIGQTILADLVGSVVLSSQFRNGDGLISYYGQRFLPIAGTPKTPLMLEQVDGVGGATVSERVLGMPVGYAAFPGDQVGSTTLSRYMTQRPAVAAEGYVHTSQFKPLIGDHESEVNIPSACNDPELCLHDTWLNIRGLLLALHGGEASPNFPTTTGPAVSVSTVSCTAPTVGQSMTCTVVGNNLPTTVSFSASNCAPSPMAIVAGSSGTQQQFTCTPVTAGIAVSISYAVTGFIGPLPIVPAIAAVNPTPASATNAVQLTDTGIAANQCREVGSDGLVSCTGVGALALSSRQDGMVGRDADASSNSGLDGKLGFSYRSVPGGCVQDNVTGLMWEVKTADGGLRDFNNAYTNFDDPSQPQSSNVNPTQAQIDAATNSVGFMKAVNSQGLCGFNDWRMPTVDELQGLVDYGGLVLEPSIDAVWFPNTRVGGYWTASRSPLAASGAWIVYFDGGSIGSDSRAARFYRVRLVRTVR